MTLAVRTITAAQHAAFISTRTWVAIEQTPGWGRGHVTGRYESIGWFDKDLLVGAGLARYRGLPRLPMRSVATFDSGPDLDWTGRRRRAIPAKEWLAPLVEHLRSRGAFTARISPMTPSRVWPAFDPAAVSDSREVAIRVEQPSTSDAESARQRLKQAGWRVMRTARQRFLAEIPLRAPGSEPPGPEPGGSGVNIRKGRIDDLPSVAAATKFEHPDEPAHSAERMRDTWRGLASDDHGRVTLLVAERDGVICYGTMFAVVGARAWDLSEAFTEPRTAVDAVLALRRRMLAESASARAKALVVASRPVAEGALMPQLAWGWGSVRLTELMPTWQYPVRATWHSTLAPVVNRLVR